MCVCSEARLLSSPCSMPVHTRAHSSLWIQHETTALNSHQRRVCSRALPDGWQALA